MKRLLSFATMLVVALVSLSCEKAEDPVTIDFGQNLYTIYAKGETTVDLNLGEAPENDINIPLTFAGKAVLGTDYNVSSKTVLIKAGETSGTVRIQELSLSADKQISITFEAPDGYVAGNKFQAVVSMSNEEALIYKFKFAKANLHESYVAEVELAGTESGKEFKAEKDIAVPLKLTGDGASLIKFEQVTRTDIAGEDVPTLVVPAGQNKGQIRLVLKDAAFKGNEAAVLTVNRAINPRLIPSDENAEELVNVWGLLSPDRLVGTWEFVKVYNQEEIELWFMEMEDDPELLPTHNQGFQFTIAKNGSDYEIIPNDKGDFAAFFRKSSIKEGDPKNGCAKFVKLGKHSLEEAPMFMEADGYTYVQNFYYNLAKVNRAFDASSETLGASTIAISMIDENHLQLHLRDYDAPPFSIMWWDDSKFDPDMFGFASEFKKVK